MKKKVTWRRFFFLLGKKIRWWFILNRRILIGVTGTLFCFGCLLYDYMKSIPVSPGSLALFVLMVGYTYYVSRKEGWMDTDD